MENLYTTEDVAYRLGVTERRVRMIAHEQEAGRKIGKIWLFTADDIREMRKRNKKVGRPRIVA